MTGLGNQWPSKVADWGLSALVGSGVLSVLAWSATTVSTHWGTALAIALGTCFLAALVFVLWRIVRSQPWLLSALVWEAWVPRRVDGLYLRKLVVHTHRMYFAFAAACDDSEMGRALDKMLWDWRGQTNVLHKLFLAEDRSQGPDAQIKAIEYVCVNRAEVSRFFSNEPHDVLSRVVRDKLVAKEVKTFAEQWQQTIGTQSDPQQPDTAPRDAPPPSAHVEGRP